MEVSVCNDHDYDAAKERAVLPLTHTQRWALARCAAHAPSDDIAAIVTGMLYQDANVVDEIDRLRLTDAERQAIKEAADAHEQNNGDPDCERIADTLHGLLERM